MNFRLENSSPGRGQCLAMGGSGLNPIYMECLHLGLRYNLWYHMCQSNALVLPCLSINTGSWVVPTHGRAQYLMATKIVTNASRVFFSNYDKTDFTLTSISKASILLSIFSWSQNRFSSHTQMVMVSAAKVIKIQSTDSGAECMLYARTQDQTPRSLPVGEKFHGRWSSAMDIFFILYHHYPSKFLF